MMFPSNFDDEIIKLKEVVSNRLNIAAKEIVEEEVKKILGRVKILKQVDLDSLQYEWFIEKLKDN